METIGILYHPRKVEARTLADEVQMWLEEQGQGTWLAPGRGGPFPAGGELAEQMAGTDLLVVLGGDGSTLRAARAAAPYHVPIFGINMGRVGFLSEASPDNWPERLARVLAGEGWLEERLMLKACLQRDGRELARFVALNDVVVGRGAKARVLRLHLSVDDDLVTTFLDAHLRGIGEGARAGAWPGVHEAR